MYCLKSWTREKVLECHQLWISQNLQYSEQLRMISTNTQDNMQPLKYKKNKNEFSYL